MRLKGISFNVQSHSDRLNAFLFFLEILTVIMPSSINHISPWIFQGMLMLFVMMECMFLLLRHPKNLPIMSVENGILAFTGVQLLITLLLRSSPLLASMKYPLSVLLTVLCVMRRIRNNPDATIHQIAVIFYIIILINTVSIAAFPNGIYKNMSPSGNWQTAYFLGVDNQFGKTLYPGLALIWFDEQRRRGHEKKVTFVTLSTVLMVSFSYIYIKNGTGMISLFFLYVLFFMYYHVNINKKAFIALFILAVSVVMLYLILEAATENNNSVIMSVISGLLGKTPDFSGRAPIWGKVLRSILHRPLFGYGQQPDDIAARIHGSNFNSHNKLLQTLYECGVFGTTFLIGTIVLAVRRGRAHLDTTPEVMILFIGMFVTGIYFMMEVGTFTPFFILLLVAGHSQSMSVKNQLKLWLRRHLPSVLSDL